MLKKYEYFCNMVNEMRLADKKFKFEIERVYRIHGNGKAADTASYRLNKKENEVEQFLQKVFKTSDFHIQLLKEDVSSNDYQKFFKLCTNLAKAEKKYWQMARDFNNRLIEFPATIKPVKALDDAEAELNLFLNKVFDKWFNKSVNVEELKVSV